MESFQIKQEHGNKTIVVVWPLQPNIIFQKKLLKVVVIFLTTTI